MTTYEDTINKDAPKTPMTLGRFMSPDNSGGLLLVANPVLLTGGLAYGINHPMAGLAIAGAATGVLVAEVLMLKANLRTAFKAMAVSAVAGAAVGAFAVTPYILNERAKDAEVRDIAEKAFFVDVRNRPVADANQLFAFAKDSLCSNSAIPEANMPEGRYKLITLPDKTQSRVPCP